MTLKKKHCQLDQNKKLSSPIAIPQDMTSQVKPIAPKPRSQGSLVAKDSIANLMRGTRQKLSVHPTLGYPIPPPMAPKVARRNARERNRVKQVNCGFEILRNQIPTAAKHKKMSKVDTLRHAVDYIRHLKQMLKDDCDVKSEVSVNAKDFDSLSPTQLTSDSPMTTSSLQHQPQLTQAQMRPSQLSSVLMSPNSGFSNLGHSLLLPPDSGEVPFDRHHLYPTHNPNLMSPMSDQTFNNNPVHQLHSLRAQPQGFSSQHLQAVTDQTSNVYCRDRISPPTSVDTSPSVYSESSAFFPSTHFPEATLTQQNYYYSDCLDPNSEEDELLDAIVKWQED